MKLPWRRKRDIATAAFALFMIFIFWLGNIDISQRGPGLAMAVLITVSFSLIIWTCPFWRYEDGERLP